MPRMPTLPKRSQRSSLVSYIPLLLKSSAGISSAPAASIFSMNALFFFGFPSITTARIPSLPSFCPGRPPALDSLMPPVRGLLPPTEIRPELGAMDPASNPGATTSLLLGPRGWQRGGTSSATTLDVNARPPKRRYFSGSSSKVTVLLVMSILSSLPKADPPFTCQKCYPFAAVFLITRPYINSRK